MIFASQLEIANTSYLWLYVLVGVITIAASVITAGRWLRRQGARDSKLDELIDPKTGVMVQLAEITKNLSPNGKDTQGVGDITARIEEAVGKLDRTLERHIGACNSEHRSLQRQIDRKQNKEAA